ncbi:MAG TPA: O-antigen ligase family protein [Patescibacteria group bacterium]|nr:O-antigen ligase family protein [Patescibacteria group bacterium]
MLPILLTLTAAFAVLTWSDLHKGLFLLVAVLPSYLLRTVIFGIPTTLLELLVVTFLIVWMVRRSPVPSFPSGPPPSQGGARGGCRMGVAATAMLVLIIATISIFVAPDITSALGAWKAYFLEPILLFFVVRYELVHGDLLVSKLFEALGLCAIALSLIAIFQWLTGMGLPIPWDIERRVTSVFDYPNALGLFLGPIVIIGLLRLCHPERATRAEGSRVYSFEIPPPLTTVVGMTQTKVLSGRDDNRLFWFLVTILSSIAIILAQSEAAIVSIVATLLLAGLIHRKTRVLSSSLLVLLVLLILLLPPLLSKLTLQDYSGGVRLSQWTETVDMLREHWFFGAGLSGYPTVFEPYHQATHLEIFQYPHNIILNIWVELGLLGLVAFIALTYQVLMSFRPRSSDDRAEKSRDPSASLGMTQTIAFLALLQMSIHGLVDVPYFKNDLAILTWILLAIVFTYARHTPSLSKTS